MKLNTVPILFVIITLTSCTNPHPINPPTSPTSPPSDVSIELPTEQPAQPQPDQQPDISTDPAEVVLSSLITGVPYNDPIRDYIDSYPQVWYLPIQTEPDNPEDTPVSTKDAFDRLADGEIEDPEEAEYLKQQVIEEYGQEYYEHLMNHTLDELFPEEPQPEPTSQPSDATDPNIKYDAKNMPYISISDINFDSKGIGNVQYKGNYYTAYRQELGYTPKEIQNSFTLNDFKLVNIQQLNDTTSRYTFRTNTPDQILFLTVDQNYTNIQLDWRYESQITPP